MQLLHHLVVIRSHGTESVSYTHLILLFVILLAVSCGEPPMPPSDEEMIRHFTTHEVAFRKAVSYTHLDVYKRQFLDGCLLAPV